MSRGLHRIGIRLLAAMALIAAPLPLSAQLTRSNVAKLAFEEGVIVVDARGDNKVDIGAAHGDSTLKLTLEPRALKEFVDSTAKLLSYNVRPTRRGRLFRSSIDELKSGAGLSFTRHVTRRGSTYRLFFANRSYGGFPFELNRREAGIFVNALRRSVTAARALSKAASDSSRGRGSPRSRRGKRGQP